MLVNSIVSILLNVLAAGVTVGRNEADADISDAVSKAEASARWFVAFFSLE